jgi:early secretory antigenic target protein ESAT-6
MTTYQVNSESVFHAAQNARATIGRVQADLQQLTLSLQALQGSWSGTAATAFQSVVSEWRATQTAVEGQLIQITESLGLAAQHYVDMEAQNARLFIR